MDQAARTLFQNIGYSIVAGGERRRRLLSLAELTLTDANSVAQFLATMAGTFDASISADELQARVFEEASKWRWGGDADCGTHRVALQLAPPTSGSCHARDPCPSPSPPLQPSQQLSTLTPSRRPWRAR